MIFREIPDHTRPGFNLDAPCESRGWPNMVIHAATREADVPSHAGPLSIKCAYTGCEEYRTTTDRFMVDECCYLVLNRGTVYSSRIESPADVETFCIFFDDAFVRKTLDGLVTASDHFLDEDTGSNITFFEKLYEHDDLVTPHLDRIRAASSVSTVNDVWLEDQLRMVLEALLMVHRKVGAEIAGMPVVRSSTRIELYRRLQRAREFMRENLGRAISIPDIAEAACFSPHHFLRVFKQAYGHTPHQHLTHLRLDLARRLLVHTRRSVTDICFEIGFESLGSFSSLFSRHNGLSPEQYRFHHTSKNAIFKK